MNVLSISVFILLSIGITFDSTLNESTSQQSHHTLQTPSAAKSKALIVLKNKCNSCHLEKNRSVIFDLQNMSSKAHEIQTQVFVKKRMPKGKIKLSETEMAELRLWLKEELH